MPSNIEIVPTGPYFGFTLARLEEELVRYTAARARSGSRLAASNINGQALTFSAVRADWSLDTWQIELQWALYYLNPGAYPFPPAANAALLTDC